jgi:hypothetical protein
MHALWHSSAILRPARTSSFFPFRRLGDKDQFLDLVRSNEEMGSDYIENDFMSPTTEEIRNARPLVLVLPEEHCEPCEADCISSLCWYRRRSCGVVRRLLRALIRNRSRVADDSEVDGDKRVRGLISRRLRKDRARILQSSPFHHLCRLISWR